MNKKLLICPKDYQEWALELYEKTWNRSYKILEVFEMPKEVSDFREFIFLKSWTVSYPLIAVYNFDSIFDSLASAGIFICEFVSLIDYTQ